MKYTSLKRHKYKNRALEILEKAKIKLVLTPILKNSVNEAELRNPRTKRLIELIHYFPLERFLDEFEREDIRFQLVFDEIGWVGCQEDIIQSFKTNPRLDWSQARPDWVRFAKSGGSLMLQLADLFAGLGYEYIDGFQRINLPPCPVCWSKGGRICGSLPQNNLNLLTTVYPFLLKDERGVAWDVGFIVRPPNMCRNYMFVDCLLNPKIRQLRAR